jgi:hypothetical protein
MASRPEPTRRIVDHPETQKNQILAPYGDFVELCPARLSTVRRASPTALWAKVAGYPSASEADLCRMTNSRRRYSGSRLRITLRVPDSA